MVHWLKKTYKIKENWALFTDVLTETNLLYGYLVPTVSRLPTGYTQTVSPYRGIQHWLFRYPN